MNINDAKIVLMVGIAGSGMRGLAYLLAETGKQIIGTDRDSSELESFSKNNKYTFLDEREAVKSLKDIDVVVLTDAVAKDHLVIKEAKKSGVEILFYHEALAQLVNRYKVIAVAGTHGKTSTSALISHILIAGGLDPSALVGANVKGWQDKSARVGKGKYFIVEADEYRDHFLQLKPEMGVITSIDYDHADFFSSLDAVRESFSKFIGNVKEDGRVIVGRKTYEDNSEIIWHKNTVVVDELPQDLELNIYGEHMRQNAALAMKVGEVAEVPMASMVEAINSFSGVARRMEEIGTYKGMVLISDYGHHPAEISATLMSIREKYKDKRVVVFFEAHTLKRLTTFKDAFIEALAMADGIVLMPVFVPVGREKESREAKEYMDLFFKDLRNKNKNVWMIDDFKDLERVINDASSSTFDVGVAFTAGYADRYLRELVK